MEDVEHYRHLERLYLQARCNEYYEPFIRIGEGVAEVRLNVREDFFHGMDAVHGSVYFKVMDDAAFFAANSLVKDIFLLTTAFQVHFLRPVRDGQMIARGRVLHRSRQLWIAEAVVVDGRGREISRGTGTFMKSRVALP